MFNNIENMCRASGEERNLKKNTIVTAFIIILVATLTLPPLFFRAQGASTKITSVSPQKGKVKDSIYLAGTINTTNGPYIIWFGEQNVSNISPARTAIGNDVTATFSVPQIPSGNYTIALQDVNKNINATTWFYVSSAYYVKAITPTAPRQLQENSTVGIWVNVTGGARNTVYSANITVTFPSPGNETYWTLVKLTNTTDTGQGYNMDVVYPSGFHGTSHANYTGTYAAAFNKTLALNTFTIGLTNSTEYHRFQRVSIQAAGYRSNENVTVKISYGQKIVNKASVNATSRGLISAGWTVPKNASVGLYTLNVTSTRGPTTKNPPDVQYFTVPGFDVNLTTRNLAGETVQNVGVKVFENGASVVNATSNPVGLAQMKLEIGNYTGSAYYEGQKVGEQSINITGATSLPFSCNLTNLKVFVTGIVKGVETPIPFVRIYLTPENRTLTTDINGTAIAHSLLPNRPYVLNASQYTVLFNTTKISQLPAVAWINRNITIPNAALSIYVTDGQNRTIGNALVRAEELTENLFYENSTVDGSVVFSSVIGKYRIGVYGKINGVYVKLNNITIDLFQNEPVPIVCRLYGLNVSLKVVDYFGQIIPNANVVMRLGDLQYSPSTVSGGVTTFNNIVGGDLQVSVYLPGQSQPDTVTTIYVNSSKTVEVRLEKHVMLAGLLVDTGQFTTAMIIVITVILLLLVEVYRRRRFKPKKGSS